MSRPHLKQNPEQYIMFFIDILNSCNWRPHLRNISEHCNFTPSESIIFNKFYHSIENDIRIRVSLTGEALAIFERLKESQNRTTIEKPVKTLEELEKQDFLTPSEMDEMLRLKNSQ